MPSETAAFLGNPEHWAGAEATYDDVQPFHGGVRILIRGNGDGFTTEVDPAGGERCRHVPLGPRVVRQAFEAIVLADPLSLPEESGHVPLPDETCRTIRLVDPAGRARSVARWQREPVLAAFETAAIALTVIPKNMHAWGAKPIPAVPPRAIPAPTAPPPRLLRAAVGLFEELRWSFEAVPDKPIVRTAIVGRNGPFTLFAQARNSPDAEQLLFYSVAKTNVPPALRAAAAEFLTRANYGMVVGNFELDLSDGEVRCKTYVETALDSGPVSHAQLKSALFHNVRMLDKYLPGLRKLLEEGVSPLDAWRSVEG